MVRANNSRNTLLCCAVLAGAVFLIYWRLLGSDFVFYDDAQYVTDNPHVVSGLTWQNVRWAFGTFYASNWHPLTWISHMLDAQIFGLKPGLQHLTNLLLHTANTVALFLVLQRMTGAFWRSALVAALFGIHPMHVESVAWIAERKDVLSGFFFLLALLAYTQYANTHHASRNSHHVSRFTFHVSRLRPYLLTLALFALGLMSKPMLVTLPFVLLLLDYWPLQRLNLSNGNSVLKATPPLVLEKLPFVIFSLISSLITYLAQQTGGSVETIEVLPISQRLANATMGYVLYLWKLLWPAKLNILYLRINEWPAWEVIAAAIVLAGITAVAIMAAKKIRWFAVGWFWFVGMLVPVIGLVQVGNQLIADRYSYLPSIGFFIILSWGGWTLVQRFAMQPKSTLAAAAAILVCAGWVTSIQTRVWQNCESLFEHSLKINPGNYVAHNILGTGLRRLGRLDDAKAHYLAALRLQPEHPDILNNLGVLLTEQGQYSEATNYLTQAVRLKPALTANYCKLAFVLDAQGKAAPAIAYYRECLRLDRNNITGCNNLAWLLATQPDSALRHGKEAVELAEHANQLSGYEQPALLGTLAAAYAEAGRFSDAITTAEKARDRAKARGLNEIAARNNSLLQLYRAGQAYREAQ